MNGESLEPVPVPFAPELKSQYALSRPFVACFTTGVMNGSPAVRADSG